MKESQRQKRRVWDRSLFHRLHMRRKTRCWEEEEEEERMRVCLYSQNLQIAQRSESSIFDAADVVAVQLPAHTHTHTQMGES